MSVARDLYSPVEHTEPLALDLATEAGPTVTLRGRATVLHPTRRVFVEALCGQAGLDLWGVAGCLAGAVRDGRVGGDELRRAVGLGYQVAHAGQGDETQ